MTRHEDKMFEFRRPEPKAAFTWIAVWMAALIALAMVPMDDVNSEIAATPHKLHYSQGAGPEAHDAKTTTAKVRG